MALISLSLFLPFYLSITFAHTKCPTMIISLILDQIGVSLDIHYEYEYEGGRKMAGPLSPLMQQDSAQL